MTSIIYSVLSDIVFTQTRPPRTTSLTWTTRLVSFQNLIKWGKKPKIYTPIHKKFLHILTYWSNMKEDINSAEYYLL